MGSGPSFKGDNASAGLKLPDLPIKSSWRERRWPPFLRRLKLVAGEVLRTGLLALDLPGERPLTTSSLREEKKPCFLSIKPEKAIREEGESDVIGRLLKEMKWVFGLKKEETLAEESQTVRTKLAKKAMKKHKHKHKKY